MNFDGYYAEVFQEACNLGYKAGQIDVFYYQILECFDDNKTVQQCLDEVF